MPALVYLLAMRLHLGKIDKDELLIALNQEGWEVELHRGDNWPQTKMDVIWAAAELAKEKKIHEAMKIARFYQLDADPAVDGTDKFDKEVRAGEDARIITSVRGTLSWLLQHIVASLETAYYSEILDMLEGRSDDNAEKKKLRLATGENLYVRQQATIPLEILVANMNAVKNADGTPFDFGVENRRRTETLAFKMLRENRDHPRVLEYLAAVFNRMRLLKEGPAQEVLEKFFYNSKGELNPVYLTEHAAPLAIYFAEFRELANDGFNNYWFKSFLKKLIREADDHLRSTITWHFWKTLKEDIKFYSKLQDYIPLLFEGEKQYAFIGQLDFLIEVLIDSHPLEALNLLEKATERTYDGLTTGALERFSRSFYFDQHVIEKLNEIAPEKLVVLRKNLIALKQRGFLLNNLEDLLTPADPNNEKSGLS